MPGDIVAINVKGGQVCNDRGTLIPIVSMWDLDGDQTDDIELALRLVAGPDPDNGGWWCVSVDGYEHKKHH